MSAPEVAAQLADSGYNGLFLAGDHSRAGEVWAGGAARDALEEIVRSDDFGDLERVLAAEVLYACGDGPAAGADVLADVYTRALALSGQGIALMGNLWGALWASPGDDGALGSHLVEQGEPAVPRLAALLGDDGPIRYEGSREAMLGNAQRYRVKDAAAYFLGRITGREVSFHEDFPDRDAEIGRLAAAVGDGG
jgi:hypothetical protein